MSLLHLFPLSLSLSLSFSFSLSLSLSLSLTWHFSRHCVCFSSLQDVTYDDFARVLTAAKPSVGPDDLERHEEWTKQFGQDG